MTHIVSVAFSSYCLEGGVGRIENARQNSERIHRTVVWLVLKYTYELSRFTDFK